MKVQSCTSCRACSCLQQQPVIETCWGKVFYVTAKKAYMASSRWTVLKLEVKLEAGCGMSHVYGSRSVLVLDELVLGCCRGFWLVPCHLFTSADSLSVLWDSSKAIDWCQTGRQHTLTCLPHPSVNLSWPFYLWEIVLEMQYYHLFFSFNGVHMRFLHFHYSHIY